MLYFLHLSAGKGCSCSFSCFKSIASGLWSKGQPTVQLRKKGIRSTQRRQRLSEAHIYVLLLPGLVFTVSSCILDFRASITVCIDRRILLIFLFLSKKYCNWFVLINLNFILHGTRCPLRLINSHFLKSKFHCIYFKAGRTHCF